MKALALTLVLLPAKFLHPAAETSGAPATQSAQAIEDHHAPSLAGKGTISVHRGSLEESIDGQGYFEPADPLEVRIRPKAYSGELVIKIAAPNGATLRKGDTILELDPTTIEKEIRAAKNDVTAAHANLARTQADTELAQQQEELSLKMQTEATQRAHDEVQWFEKVDGPNLLAENDLVTKNAQANVDDGQDELNELKKMYKSDDLTTDTADIVVKRSVRALANAKITLRIQQEHADKVKKEDYPARREAVLEAAQQSDEQLQSLKIAQAQVKILRETGLVTALANAKAADDHLADLQGDKDKLTVVAPVDGVLVYGQFTGGALQSGDERSFRTGERVAPQQVLMTLYTPGDMRFHIDLPEAKFYEVQPAMKASLTPVAYSSDKIEGFCDPGARVPFTSQQGPVFTLYVNCPKVDAKIVPGMRAELHATVPSLETAILVPTSAVANGRVSVKTDDGFESRPVVVGKSDGKRVEIKGGLEEGEQIFIEAQK